MMPLNSGVWKMQCNMEFTKQVFPKPTPAILPAMYAVKQYMFQYCVHNAGARLVQMPNHSL